MAKSYRAQIDRLATYIMENIPGEPSQSQGAIDTAIRLLQSQQKTIDDMTKTILVYVERDRANTGGIAGE